MISFEDVKEHPAHYKSLLIERNDPFLFFAYGPYIVMNSSIEFNNGMDELLKFMIDTAEILNVTKYFVTFKAAKENLFKIRKRLIEYPYTYSEKVLEILDNVKENIRKIQYETNSLESAILNYAPIVPYNGHLVKPGMEYQVRRVIEYDENELDKAIQNLLKNYISSILLDCEKGIQFIQTPVSWLTSLNITDPVLAYYTLVSIRYLTSTIPLQEQNMIIRNIVNISNHIQTGNLIDISKAVEAFMELEDSYDI